MTKSNKQGKQLVVYSDGGARGNPGPAGIGVYALLDKKHTFSISEFIGDTTNNVAEYLAILRALEYIIANDIVVKEFSFYLDSQLVVKQIKGEYKVKKPHLQKLNLRTKKLIQHLKTRPEVKKIEFIHITRDKNKEADQQVNDAIDRLI